MNDSTMRRQPKGIPTGGEFAMNDRDEATSSLAPEPIVAEVRGDESTAFDNGYVGVEMVPSQYGSFTTVRSGGSGTGSAVLVLNRYRQALVVQQNRYAVNEATWEIPRGGSLVGEDHSETAQREVVEETGIQLPLESIRPLGKYQPDTGLMQTEAGLFLAETDHEPSHDANPEIALRRWVDVDDLVRACATGEIKCGFTSTAVLRARVLGYI